MFVDAVGYSAPWTTATPQTSLRSGRVTVKDTCAMRPPQVTVLSAFGVQSGCCVLMMSYTEVWVASSHEKIPSVRRWALVSAVHVPKQGSELVRVVRAPSARLSVSSDEQP